MDENKPAISTQYIGLKYIFLNLLFLLQKKWVVPRETTDNVFEPEGVNFLVSGVVIKKMLKSE